MPTHEQVQQALSGVNDSLVGVPITEIGMVGNVQVADERVEVTLLLPVPDSPNEEKVTKAIQSAVGQLDGVSSVHVSTELMDDAGREVVAQAMRARRPAPSPGGQAVIPFAQMDSDTKVFAIASGKGGVGKSSITTNIAVALAQDGYEVGILDADIWGYSIPRMMGVSGRPIAFADMVLPLQAHGCKVISIGFFVDAEQPVIWRGPMLHRALQQFLADVYWGDLDFLLCDLPPGTGDIAISLAQMLPNADMLVVTTPQQAAQRVALRAGQTTAQTGMRVGGVIENMATFVAPDTGKHYAIFGEGGGKLLAEELDTTLLGSIPIDPRLREGADLGRPLILEDPDAPASKVFAEIARKMARAKTSMVGKSLPLSG